MKYIKGFDGLRALSIILVLLSHLNSRQFLPNYPYIRDQFWLLISGETGVLIFFNLSGFLITLILIKEKKETGDIKFKRFFIKRFLRLFPPFLFFCLGILTLRQLNLLDFTTEGFLLSFFYLYNYTPTAFYHNELVHTWSLAVEEQFYLIWPFVIRIFKIRKVIVLIYSLLIISFLVLFLFKLGYFSEFRRPDRWFLPASAAIIFGALLAIIISKNTNYLVNRIKHKHTPIYAFIIYLYPLYSLKYTLFLSPLIMSFGISLLVGWIYFNQYSTLTNILNFKPFIYIGKISYGVYVYQGLFLRTGPGGNLFIQQFPQNIILTFITAVISYEFIEKSFLKLKSKI
jgi:peptidoglycan/LPS O-acetylase OafA/YrhL